MATPHTYANIPPPPLPEFYLDIHTTDSDSTSSSSSSKDKAKTQTVVKVKKGAKGNGQSKETPQSIALREPPAPSHHDNVEKLPSALGDATDERLVEKDRIRVSSKSITFQPPPPSPLHAAVGTIPPLAIYHICRVCLRPRSAHYHRDHPIPVNGVPPPPGICRRCRIKHVEDVSTVRGVVIKPESDPIKLGLSSIMPSDCFIPGSDWKEMRNHHFLEAIDPQCLRKSEKPPRTEKPLIAYRHILVRDPSPDQPHEDESIEECSTLDSVDKTAVIGRQAASNAEAEVSKRPPSATKLSLTVSKLQELDKGNKSISKAKIESARAETPGYTESDIRRFARQEVQRYRQAERKLEAHPEAFAHGRVVPITSPHTQKTGPKPPVESLERSESGRSRRIDALTADQSSRLQLPPDLYEAVERYEEMRSFTKPRVSAQNSSSSYSTAEWSMEKGRNTVMAQLIESSVSQASLKQPRVGTRPCQVQKTVSAKSEVAKSQRGLGEKTQQASVGDPPLGKEDRGKESATRIEVRRVYEIGSDRQVSSIASHPTSTRPRQIWAVQDPYVESNPSMHQRATHSSASWAPHRRISELSESSRGDDPLSGLSAYREQLTSTSTHSSTSRQSGDHSATKDDDRTKSGTPRPRAFDRRWQEAERRSAVTAATESRKKALDKETDHPKEPSKPAGSSLKDGFSARSNDSEYYYRERIVEPLGTNGENDWKDMVSSTHSRTYSTQPYQQQDPRRLDSRTDSVRQEAKARDWEDSSHVRFASKVDISPTPPGSQASSEKFRVIGGRGSKGRLGGSEERGVDLILEYERRGRQKSHARPGDGEDGHERDRDHRRDHEGQGLRRALSESPSREHFQTIGGDIREDRYGPYRAPEPRTDSYEVAIGSSSARQDTGIDFGGGSSRYSAATAPARMERRS